MERSQDFPADDVTVLRSRFRGCLLGGAVGDALGMPTEVGPSRRPGQSIREVFGVDWVQEYRDSPNPNYLKAGQYSDDTQQTICLAETLLVSDGRFDAEVFYSRLTRAVEQFHRGVGPSTKRVMSAIQRGKLEALLRGEAVSQSPTNGGAMRVAPVALVYLWDLDRLMRAAKAATRATHGHPTSVAGACVQALLVAAALREGDDLDPRRLRVDIAERIQSLDPELAELIQGAAEPSQSETSCWVMDTVPAVARGFWDHQSDFCTGVLAQVNSEGDTDTKAAMVGQLIGARTGIECIPSTWLQGLEDGHRGRTYITLLADALLLLALRVRKKTAGITHSR
jgi:ADP-ribosylglycohydrolase